MSVSSETRVYKTVCMLCFMVCGINAYVRDGKLIRVEGMKEHPLNQGVICPRGEYLADYVYSPERLKYPLKKENGDWKRISWDEALDTIADKLQKIKSEFGARALALSVGSIGAENIEISGFAQRFRGAYGTPNFFSIEAHCFRSRIMARLLTFGTYPLEDPENSDCIVLWGHNPDASEPPLAAKIYKALDRGLKLIVIDPKKIPMAHKGVYAKIRPGTDCALALGMLNVIIAENLYNKEFIKKYTLGFEQLAQHVQNYSPEKVEKITWVPADKIRKIARIYAQAGSAAIIQGINTLDQHINGLQNNRVLAILQAITGNYNKPGGWATNPFMRLSDLRVTVEEEPIGAKEFPMFRRFWGRTSPYGQQMLLQDTILSEQPYPIKALIVSGGNPALSWPDTQKTKKAFQKLDLMVVMDLFMTETAELADIVLPCASSLERTGLAYNYALTAGIPYAMLSRKIIEPIGESWPDWKFYSELGRRMGYGEYFPWNSDEEVNAHWLKPSGITMEQLEENPAGLWFGKRCYDITAENQIKTPSGKIELYSETLAEAGYDPIPVYREPSQSAVSDPELASEYPLILNLGARIIEYTHYQMRNIPKLSRLAPGPQVEIHPVTARKYGVQEGDAVFLETKSGQVKAQVKITEDMAPQVVSLPHGWGGKASANLLAELKPLDPVTGYPELKALACRIRKILPQNQS
ncbi:MAG: molybdopterin-containing oxidoreductase family protein [Dethiobacteria bacterium]|jgi:anaerobic selenocysteine-containing dehydrogenase